MSGVEMKEQSISQTKDDITKSVIKIVVKLL